MNTITKRYNPFESVDEGFDYQVPKNIYPDAGDDASEDFSNLFGSPSQINNKPSPDLQIVPPAIQPMKGRYKLLQMWEGRVVSVQKETFDAIIENKTHPEFPDELVTIEIEEISQDDIKLVTEGAVFYWSVGYLDYPGRGRSRESKIRFRRLKGWTQAEIQEAKKVGKEFAEFFQSHLLHTSE